MRHLLFFILLLTPSLAFAQTPAEVELAEDHYQAGMTAFQAGDYETAAAEFQRSYDLVPKPELLYNASFALARSGNVDAAREIARDAVVTRLPADIDAKFRARLHGWRAVERAQNRPAPVVVARAEPDAPADVVIKPEPGPAPPSNGLRVASYVVGGLGIAGLLTAGALEFRLQTVGRELDRAAARDDFEGYQEALTSGRQLQNAGRITLIAGGTLLVTGVVLWLVSRKKAEGAPQAVVRF